jgi:pentatricopeptide repeat protein
MQEIGLQLIQAMLDQDIVPTILIQNRVICAWKSKLPQHVLKFFMKLRDQGVNISPTAYRCIMYAHECVDPHLTLALFDEMRTRGTKLDRVAFNAVLCSYCNVDRVDRALELYSQMPGHTLVPNGKTYGTLIRACTAAGKTEHALYLFDLMQKANIEPNRFAFNDAIQCCVKVKRLGKAVTLFRDMVQANALPLESSHKSLVQGCQSEGWVEIVSTIERHAIEARQTSLKSGKQLPPLGPLPGLDEMCRAERAKGCTQLESGIASGLSDVSSRGPASSSYSSSSSAADC